MFYEVKLHHPEGRPRACALAALTPSESKRLIAKGVAALPEVRKALQKGTVIVARGTTNGFVVEELTGASITKQHYTAGIVYDGE